MRHDVAMRSLTAAIFLTSLLPLAVKAQDAVEARQQCAASDRSHVESRACLQAKVDSSTSQLHHSEEEMIMALSTRDEEQSSKKRSLALFDSSVKAFVRYRAQHCELLASLAAGGNSAGDIRLSCFYELNQMRISEIVQAQTLLNQ
jgi:uncharacterized protein YecT (DUF1311 family)